MARRDFAQSCFALVECAKLLLLLRIPRLVENSAKGFQLRFPAVKPFFLATFRRVRMDALIFGLVGQPICQQLSRCLDVLSGGCRGASAVGGERGERSLTPFQLAGSATPLVAPEAGVR